MALPAGKKGVLPSELTPEGRIKNNGSQYVLPVATNTTLGGVKPVAKTETMTKEVGVDSEGKLFVEPSQGGGVETGSATLASGLTGYVNYIKIGNICFVTGEVTGLSSSAYTAVDLCTGLPFESDVTLLNPLIIVSDSNTATVATLLVNSEKAALSVRYGGLSSSRRYTLTGVYLCGEAEINALTLTDCTQVSNASAAVTDDYVLIYGNIEPSNFTAGVPLQISSGLPKIKENILTAFISDTVAYCNYHDLFVEDTYLKINMTNTSYKRLDGALIYKIDKGE